MAASTDSPGEGVAAREPGGSRIGSARLYLCTPDRSDLEQFVEQCILGGVEVVQLREKELGDRDLLARARKLVRVCSHHGVPFILNDRPDLALEAGADGVHVGQDDAPPSLARRILGPNAIIGLSTHRPEELQSSKAEPVDYISAGPVVATPTKPGRPGTGVGYAALASTEAGRPVFVTGGVDPSSVRRMAPAGARRFVVVRFLTRSTDPAGDARLLAQAIDDAIARAEDRPQTT